MQTPPRVLRESSPQQRRPLTHQQGRNQTFQEHLPETTLAKGERAKTEAAAGKTRFVLKRVSLHNLPQNSQSFHEANLWKSRQQAMKSQSLPQKQALPSAPYAAGTLLLIGFLSTRRSAPRARGQGGKSLMCRLQEWRALMQHSFKGWR